MGFFDNWFQSSESEKVGEDSEHNRDQEIQRDIGKILLENEGINEPVAPNPSACIPDPSAMKEAAVIIAKNERPV